MQEKHLNSKVKQTGGLHNTISKPPTSKSIKYLDFQLKEHDANFIRSRLPTQFLLINLKTAELGKIKDELQVKTLLANPVKNKQEAIEKKKNEKKVKAEQRRGNNLVFKKEKNGENNDESKEEEEQKSIFNGSLSQKAVSPPNDQDVAEKMEILHINPFAYISDVHPRNNMEGINYEFDKKDIHKHKELHYQHFANYETDKNGYQEKFEQSHFHFDAKIGQGVPYDYPMYEQEHHNWMGYFTFPFLPEGQPRYDPEFFEARPEETLEKNKLLHLFGLPFTESVIEPVQKLCELQKKFCLNFVNRLKSHKSSQIFRVAVNPEGQGIPDYYHIVYHPIDLTTIQKKVQKDKYSHIQEFHSDINKIIMNSYKYNFRETTYFIATVKFEDYYQSLLREAKENPEKFTQDPQQKIVKLKKIEDNEFYDQTELRKKKKVEQLKNESVSLHKNASKGKKERNETRFKNAKKTDENSQMFYNSMINESNDYSLPNENNFFNSISAENTKNKKDTIVHHRNMNIKKSQSFLKEGQNFEMENERLVKNDDYEENFDEFNVSGENSRKLKFQNSSYEVKQNENSMNKSKSVLKGKFEHLLSQESQVLQKPLREVDALSENENQVKNQQNFGEGSKKKEKEGEEEFGDLGNFIFKIEETKNSESEKQKSVEASKKIMSNEVPERNFIKKTSSSDIPIKTEIFGEVKEAGNRFRISDEEIKMIEGLGESIEFDVPNQESMESDELSEKEVPKDQSEESNGKLFEYFSIRQVEANKSSKNIHKSDTLNPNPKTSKVQSFQETIIQNPFQSFPCSASPAAILADSMTQQYPKVVRKMKKKEIDEDYKIESEEEYVDNVKGKKIIYKQQSSLNNEESYSQEYSIPKNRKKISKKETASLNEQKKIEPKPKKQQGNPQNEIKARIHAEMENFYKLPPIINVLEPTLVPINLLPPVEEVSLNDQHSALNSVLPVPFHSCIFLDKEDNNHPEVEQGIVDILDLIG